jgi:hypothetical protein
VHKRGFACPETSITLLDDKTLTETHLLVRGEVNDIAIVACNHEQCVRNGGLTAHGFCSRPGRREIPAKTPASERGKALLRWRSACPITTLSLNRAHSFASHTGRRPLTCACLSNRPTLPSRSSLACTQALPQSRHLLSLTSTLLVNTLAFRTLDRCL